MEKGFIISESLGGKVDKGKQEKGWEMMLIFGDMEAKYEFRNGANQKQKNRWACRLS